MRHQILEHEADAAVELTAMAMPATTTRPAEPRSPKRIHRAHRARLVSDKSMLLP